jgi:DNA-directed RNA polymerase beta subunit
MLCHANNNDLSFCFQVECLWAHGCLAFLKERIAECSDNYRVHACKDCGRMAVVNQDTRLFQCRYCDNAVAFVEVRMPYTFKLLLQELEAMSVGSRLIGASPASEATPKGKGKGKDSR